MSTTSPSTVKALRKAVDNARGPEDGTVVRLVREVAGDYDPMRDQNVIVRKQRLTYAAVFVNNHWYLTGTVNPQSAQRTQHLTHRAFIDFIGGDDIVYAEVATAFEGVA
ncbi:hypothetical protein SEA_EULA_60 [Microbacterium phage Eula]|uniref:hypothetical protein n=1 Tax=Microbacterium phage Eula TaxID=2926098 RepID=UPI0021FE260A|nr:hypothetical protein QDW40_gp60 [Microbacterium phage Eula]UVF61115.1 hypothetical protein SEA_EULA_60 [Microbacterium phage Eula]